MIKAFVFGKFSPFHKGHEAMIHFALNKCNFLTVLICCSDKEDISASLRKSWIEKTFANQKNIEVKTFNYLESDLPNTSQTSEEVSKIWSAVFKSLFPDYSLLITSEDYGNFVAEFMNIKHIPFNIPKILFPVSATDVRENLFANWKFLPDSVKETYAIKVVILGTESTGKTTMARLLAKYFACSLVLEAARDLIQNSNKFTFDDLHLVANEHAKQIDKAVVAESPLVIIDTDIHTTKSYSILTFEKELLVSDEIYKSNQANLYLYLNNDVEYLQDGTRLNEAQRNLLEISNRKVLKEHNIKIVEITGNWQERFCKAVGHIKKVTAVKGNKKWLKEQLTDIEQEIN